MLDMNLASRLATDETVRKLVSGANHYFVEMPGARWRFFHNSFRQFVLDKTGRNAFAIVDPEANRHFHERLADLAASDESTTIFRWEKIYHQYGAGRIDDVLNTATQTYFRGQFFQSRPDNFISDDLVLVMRAAKERLDKIAAIRVLLTKYEITARSEVVSQTDLPGLLLAVGEQEQAAKYIIHDGELLIEPSDALGLARQLADDGFGELGREIFDAAEPLGLLVGTASSIIVGHDEETLDSWVNAAVRFRPIREIIKVIAGVVSRNTATSASADEANRQLRQRLFVELADAVVGSGTREEINTLPELLAGHLKESALRQRIADAIVRSDADPIWRSENAQFLLSSHAESPLPDEIAVGIAGFLLREKDDVANAQRLFSDLAPPARFADEHGYPHDIGPYVYTLRYCRIAAALGNPVDPMSAVPDKGRDYDRGKIQIGRMVVRIASLGGMPGAEKPHRLSPLFACWHPPYFWPRVGMTTNLPSRSPGLFMTIWRS